jgi:hypothetical protein
LRKNGPTVGSWKISKVQEGTQKNAKSKGFVWQRQELQTKKRNFAAQKTTLAMDGIASELINWEEKYDV